MIEGTRSGGKVYLVGAGPGDSELMTVKARRVLDGADTVLHDSLVGTDIVQAIAPDVETIDVGKRPADGRRTSQDEIHRILVERARRGEIVARLKGGDPTVYGRGGEEAQHLAAAGIAFEIVPGVSSVVAAPGVTGIPLTHRDLSSSLTVITGHEAIKEESAIDWEAIGSMLARGGTLLILMGVRTLPGNVTRLREAGVSADTPVAMISRATWDDETTVTGTLDTIVPQAEVAEITPPAVTVIGDVVDVRADVKDSLVRQDLHAGSAEAATVLGNERREHVPIGVLPR